MPNLVGIGLSQVPTNSMLGGLAYQDPEHASIKDLDLKNLSQINSEISDTAVDIFVYDTRKDSDGGAWRKRTQHTSWYNETLGTATRGTRREFPAVAVITVESGNQTNAMITIYDGDDPDLPMWMVFYNGTSGGGDNQTTSTKYYAAGPYQTRKVAMLNGIMVDCQYRSSGHIDNIVKGVTRFNFIDDSSTMMTDEGDFKRLGNLGDERNTVKTYAKISTTEIVHTQCNDIAMTVLPNAPIDDTTGLPIPTIAVGTDGGVSIIKDDGSVVDLTITTGANNDGDRIDFTDDNRLVIQWGGDSAGEITIDEIPSADTSANYPINLPGSHYNDNSPASYTPNFLTEGPSTTNRHPTAISQFRAVGTTAALSVFEENKESEEDGMVAFISSSYNTGYQQGRIKGAFLSDTDTTNVSADTLNSVNTFDGTFATSTGWTTDSDWTISGGVASCSGANAGRFIYPTSDRWTVGSSVVVEVTVTAYTSGTLYVSYATGAATSGTDMTATGTYKFVNNVSGNDLIYIRSESFIGSIDNVKIYYAEYDRSLNNKGLIPYGTITKSAVATGAELVSYSGWSSSNYLIQPYNSDLDFGTGDWCYMFWYNPNDAESGDVIFSRWSYNVDSVSAPRIQAYFNNGNLRVDTSDASAGTAYQGHFGSDGTQDSNEWHCAVILRRGPNLEIWIDGKDYKTGSLNVNSDGSYTKTNAIIEIGSSPGGGTEEAGLELALFRISGTAPSPEQIKKIYEDEKVLFQENAACTLYGSSDAVTALAYDDSTNLLYAGTSSGRSDFQGLRRINNTTEAVTTAISASNGLVAEQ